MFINLEMMNAEILGYVQLRFTIEYTQCRLQNICEHKFENTNSKTKKISNVKKFMAIDYFKELQVNSFLFICQNF